MEVVDCSSSDDEVEVVGDDCSGVAGDGKATCSAVERLDDSVLGLEGLSSVLDPRDSDVALRNSPRRSPRLLEKGVGSPSSRLLGQGNVGSVGSPRQSSRFQHGDSNPGNCFNPRRSPRLAAKSGNSSFGRLWSQIRMWVVRRSLLWGCCLVAWVKWRCFTKNMPRVKGLVLLELKGLTMSRRKGVLQLGNVSVRVILILNQLGNPRGRPKINLSLKMLIRSCVIRKGIIRRNASAQPCCMPA